MPALLKSITTLCALTALATVAAAENPVPAPPTDTSVPRLERADLEAWLDGLVPYALQQGDLAGLVVSVVKDGQVVLEKGYGYADIAKQIPADPQRTMLRAASVSKPFTATAVMQLVEQGRLDLDRDVNEYLDFRIPPTYDQPITLRHLLTHTAGFEETSYKRYNPPRTLREDLLTIPDRIYPPGTVPAYSNYSLNLAGYIVARVAGQPISQYVQQHILDPLGMKYSTFQMTFPEELRELEAKNYPLASSREPYPPSLILELSPTESPAGGLATTAHDMTRFMLAHLQQGRHGDYQLLRPQSVAVMHASSFVPIPGTNPVALGLFRTDYNGQRVIGHSGDGEGAHADMRLLLDQNVGFYVAINSDGVVGSLLPAAMALRTSLFELFVDRYFPATSPQEPTASTALEHARLAAGEYVWSRQPKGDYQEALFLIARYVALKLNISANDDGTITTDALVGFEKNGRAQTWREVRPFVWREVGGDSHLYMKVEGGQVQSVWTDAVASFLVNLRVAPLWSAVLNVPLLGMATGTLLIAALLWPVAALVRRRYGQALQLADPERRAYRWTRFAVVVGVLYMLGWVIAMIADFASMVGAAPWIRLLQLLGLLCVAGTVVAGWNAWLTCRGKRSAWNKVGSVVVALALLYLVWFSLAFHLISLRLS